MFIPSDQKPWFCKVKEYMAHPEYEFATINTIAIVELLPNEDEYFPMTPICVPGSSFNASNQLYAIGFTDENQLLEKMIYKLQYIEQGLCDEFYNRAGLSEGKIVPTSYQCGFAVNNKDNCVWENGMVITSNSTGKWTLLGLSVKGPGCAAPARFIDVTAYIPWLESATSLDDMYYPDYGRRSLTEERDGIVDIPAHALFRSGNTSISGRPMLTEPYQFDVDAFAYLNVERIDKDAIVVARFDTMYERKKGDCSQYKMLVYRELTKVVAPGLRGTASYKLTLYDMWVMNYTCIKMRIHSQNRTNAYLYYKKTINMYQGTAFGTFGDTPEDILKVRPIDKLEYAVKSTNVTSPPVWKPGSRMEEKFITDESKILGIPNINLWVQCIFTDEAVIIFEIYGKPYRSNDTFVSTTRGPRKSKKKRIRTKKVKVNKTTVDGEPAVAGRTLLRYSKVMPLVRSSAERVEATIGTMLVLKYLIK
ncbi:hypothetical protein O3G_MSEX002835 [Manduca sexta]|nr:hypothetical protein O3G_MSEX002835 [Manduca sexta]